MANCKYCTHVKVCELSTKYFLYKNNGVLDFQDSDCEFFQDFEKIIEFPCIVGEKVFGIRGKKNPIVVSGTVIDIEYSHNGKFLIISRNKFRGYWGYSVFSTREEAENALHDIFGGKNAT